MDRLLMVSADNHCGPSAADYAPYFEKKYRHAAQIAIAEEADFIAITEQYSSFPEYILDAIDHRGAIRSGGVDGRCNLTRRLKEMDDEGIAAEIAYAGCQFQLPPFFTHVGRAHPAALRSAGARAHHRWFVDFRDSAKDRVFGVADPGGSQDISASVDELHWCADQGFVAIGCPGAIRDDSLPPLYDEYYEPFWRACAERDLVLSIHIGWGRDQGGFFNEGPVRTLDPVLSKFLANCSEAKVNRFVQKLQSKPVDMAPRRAFWQLLLGGVLDRYPTLKIVFAEVHSDWLPDTLAFLDKLFETERGKAQLKPSEYFLRQGFVTPTSPRRAEIAQRERIGIEKMMLGVDYPHPESTWPNTQEWLGDLFKGLSEYEIRRFCGENAIDCFGLDRDKLSTIAARIGPRLEDLQQAPPVSPAIRQHFSDRAGYEHPAERVDEELLNMYVEADVANAHNS